MNDVNSSIKIDIVDSSSSTILTKPKYVSANGVWLQTRLLCSASKKTIIHETWHWFRTDLEFSVSFCKISPYYKQLFEI